MPLFPSRMPHQSILRTAIVCWVLLSVVLIGEDRALFKGPLYEQADDAANALSIDAAKHGTEIYGNYSRFEFRHPGPAFVYFYAFGEVVLEDWLHLVSPRHNAHLLTGILLQAAFLALALGVAASHGTRPWGACIVLCGLGLVHFSWVSGAFTQIWPPLVLIMPFVLLVVSAASVASGRSDHAILLVLASAFLLHGHVAQFLLVGGVWLFVLVALFLRRARGRPFESLSKSQLIWIGIVIALALAPWVIDAARGRGSNIFNIWLHVRKSEQDALRPGWRVAFLDTLSYFGYCTRQETWFSPGATGTAASFLQAYGWGCAASSFGVLSSAVVLWQARGERGPIRAFQRSLGALCLWVFCLCVVWAKRQDGGVTFFNSLFVFGLMMAIWIIPALSFIEALSGSAVAWVATGIACIVGATAGRYGETPDYMRAETRGLAAAAKVPAWLASEAHPENPKLLIFRHDDWDDAVTVAAALNRAGVRFFVPESDYGIWRLMFGEGHILHSVEEAAANGPFSWWEPTLNAEPARNGLNPGMIEVPNDRLRRFPFQFDFKSNRDSFGLSAPEPGGVWTESRVVILRLWSTEAASDVRIQFLASAVPLNRGMNQRVQLRVNGVSLPELRVTRRDGYSAVVPKEAWNRGSSPGYVEILMGLPDSGRLIAEPRSTSREGRLLGIFLEKLEFALVTDPPLAGQ